MFQINLENIYRSAVGEIETIDLGGQIKLPDDITSEPTEIKCRISLNRVNDGLIFNFELGSKSITVCDRCLKPTVLETKSTFDHFLEINQLIHLRDYLFDTEPLLIENIILEIPIQKLCRPDCKGICQNCGADLNAKKCNCEIDNKSNPFKALKKEVNGPTKEKDLKS